MPTPTAWGAQVQPAKSAGAYRLERGEILFEKIHVRLTPESDLPPTSNNDDIIGKKSDRLFLLRDTGKTQDKTADAPSSRYLSGKSADLNRPGESDAIRDELVEQLKSIWFHIAGCFIAVLFLGMVEILPVFSVPLPDMFLPDRAPVVYLSLNLALGAFCIVLCHSRFSGIWSSIKKLRVDATVVLTVASTASMLHCAAQLVYCIVKNVAAHRVYIAPLVLALLINEIGMLFLTRRVARNFSFVALHDGNLAARLMPTGGHYDNIRSSVKGYPGCTVYSVKAERITDYLDYAYEEDKCEEMSAQLSPYVLIVALTAGLLGGIVGFSQYGIWAGVCSFCASAIACIPCARTLCLNFSLDIHTKRLLKRGVMLNGWAGADEFGLTDTLVLSDNDLFPEGAIKLISVKPFGKEPLSDTLIYAASLAFPCGGPIAQVFEGLLDRKHSRIRPVEGLGYELGTGISGWVDGRPVLVGTRELLIAHGCNVPSRSYEKYIGKEDAGKRVVYVAVSGVARAALCISYEPDIKCIEAVRNLVSMGTRLVVHSCDCNVTDELISEMYGIPQKYVTILDMRFSESWQALTIDAGDEAPALLVCRNSIASLATGIAAARNLRGISILSSVLWTVCFGLCLTLVAVICCIAPMSGISPAQLLLLQLITPLISLVGLLQRTI